MGANNWGVCPACQSADMTKNAEAAAALEDAYGKVDSAKYQRMRDALQAASRKVDSIQTLREDYCIRMSSDGVLTVGYHAQCECGFTHEFNHTEQVI